jgi:hypothetical protein
MTDAAGREGRVIRENALAKQRFGDRSAAQIGEVGDLLAGAEGALADQDRSC